jgi:class 3 adenylate cyclase/predicted ATPase
LDIAAWLTGLGLERYRQVFLENEIDLAVLPKLTADDLKDMGVLIVGHRRKLLAAIAEMGAAPNSADVPPVTALGGISHQADAERRQLTVMFVDLVGSTPLAARLDAEELREVIAAYQRRVAETVSQYNGYIAKYMGDGVLVYFGYPRAQEGDAERAVRAGLALVDAHGDGGQRLKLRIGIETGMVVVGDLIGAGASQECSVVGETPNLAARLQAMAEPDNVMIGPGTRRLLGSLFELRDLGAVQIRGLVEPVNAYRVLRQAVVQNRFEAFRGEVPLPPPIGRDDDLQVLLRRWERARDGQGQLVLLSGEPGIGKSRLTDAFLHQLSREPATGMCYFCSPHHADSALYPFIGQLERAAGFERTDTAEVRLDKLDALLGQAATPAEDSGLIADLLSLPHSGRYATPDLTPQRRRRRTLDSLVGLFSRFSAARPVVMIFEDAHWADPTSLELLDQTVTRLRHLRLLAIVTYRPEFLPSWTGQSQVTSLTLSRLAYDESVALVRLVAGNNALADAVVHEIVERADGVPLFVEELTKAVLEAGEGAAAGRVASVPNAATAVPATLYASLMARLDRLHPGKETAQIGAAIGREFSYELVAAVTDGSDRDLRRALDQLGAAGLVFPRGVPPDATYLFKHALVQDVAYGTLLRGRRQELHARIGRALEEQFPESVATQPEILAHHFGQAGLIDTAITYWRKAGEYALGRSANAEAVAHLSRGIELTESLPAGDNRDQREFGLTLALGSAIRATKGHAAPETLRVYSRARELLSDGMGVTEKMAVLYGLWAVNIVRAELIPGWEVAQQSLALAERQPGPEASAFANRMMGFTLWATGEFAEAVPYLKRTIELYGPGQANVTDLRYSQDHGVWALSILALTLWTLGYPEQAVAMANNALQRAHEIGHAMTTGFAYIFRLVLNGHLQPDPQRDALISDRAMLFCVEHDLKAYIPWARFYQGGLLFRRGNNQQGLELMRASMTAAELISAKFLRPIHLGHLASAHAAFGEPEVALDLLGQAIAVAEETHERFFEPELYRIHGELLLDLGKEQDGIADLEQALSISRTQQARLFEIRAARRLAQFWRDHGTMQRAGAVLAPAYDWFAEGFGTSDLSQAKALLDELRA